MPARVPTRRQRRGLLVAFAAVLLPWSAEAATAAQSAKAAAAQGGRGGAAAGAAAGGDTEQAREEALAGLVALLLPEPFGRERLLDFSGRWWPRGDEHLAALDAAERYLLATAEARERIRRPAAILVEPAHAWDAVSRAYQPRYGSEYVALLEGCRRWNAALDDAEKTLLDAWMLLPRSDGSAPALQLRWERALERDDRPVHDPLAALRLDEVLGQIQMDAAQRAALAPEVDLWKERAAAALRERRRRLEQLALERARLEARWGAWWREGASPDLRLQREEALELISRAERNADTTPADVNAASLRTVRARMGPLAQRQLDERTGRLLHPLVFDDSRSLRRLLTRLAEAPGLDEDQRAALGGLAAEAATRLAPLELAALKPAAELTDAEEALQMEPSSIPGAVRVLELQRTMLGHAEKRRRAVQELLRMARGLVPTEPLAVAAQLDDALASLQARARDDAARRSQLETRLMELARPVEPLPPEEPPGDNVRPGPTGAPENTP